MVTRRTAVALVALLALAVPSVTSSQAVLGEDPVASHYFTIEWQVDQKRTISGYVQNRYGQPMTSVRLVVEMMDGSQTVVGRRYEWLGRDLAPFTGSYFQISKLPPAASYRVAVNSFSILQGQGTFP